MPGKELANNNAVAVPIKNSPKYFKERPEITTITVGNEIPLS